MSSTIESGVLSPEQAARMSPSEIVDLSRSYATLSDEVAALKHQLEWFKRAGTGLDGQLRKRLTRQRQGLSGARRGAGPKSGVACSTRMASADRPYKEIIAHGAGAQL